jgi:hypothetical protein
MRESVPIDIGKAGGSNPPISTTFSEFQPVRRRYLP